MNDNGLTSLVLSWTPRPVEVPGVGLFHVREPTVREALSVYGLLPPAAGGGEDSAYALRQVLLGWLPRRLVEYLYREGVTWKDRADFLKQLLASRETYDAGEKDEQPVVYTRRRDWSDTLAEYRFTYDAPDVLSEPWHFFLGQLKAMEGVIALNMVHEMTWYASAKTGKGQKLFERAGFERVLRWTRPPHQDDEWFEKQREAARQYAQNRRNGKEK